MKNIWELSMLIGLYVLATLILILLFDKVGGFALSISIPANVSIILGMITGFRILASVLKLSIIEVEANKVALISDPFFPKEEKGTTVFDLYSTGFGIKYPWEVRNEDINLETDLVDEMTFTTSSNDDDIKVTIQYDAQPDHEELSTYLMNGKDETERTKNIKLSVSTFIKRQVEILVSSIDSCDVINGTKSKEIMKTVTRLIKEGEVISEDPKETKESLEKVLGITIRNIQFGDIDYSDEISEARNNKKVIQKQAEAIKELSDKTGMGMEEAAKFVQSENGSATRIIFDAPPTLSSVTVLPGAIQPENKKSKKKGNS